MLITIKSWVGKRMLFDVCYFDILIKTQNVKSAYIWRQLVHSSMLTSWYFDISMQLYWACVLALSQETKYGPPSGAVTWIWHNYNDLNY